MAKKNKEEVIEEITPKQEEQVVEEKPKEEEVKKNEVLEDGTVKVDLRQHVEKEEIAEAPADTKEEEPVVEEVVELEEITEEEQVQVEQLNETVAEAIEVAQEQGTKLPDNIQKVITFMEDTGGTLEDYVQLNKDYSKMSDNELLSEYFKRTKPHLTDEERSFVMEDLYSYDEDIDEDIEIKRKKLALKEQVANAKSHLDGLKSKYYDEIKAGSRLNPEQQKAIEFFNRHNKNQTVVEDNAKFFKQKTNEVFSDTFKGFEYNVGDKRFRLNVKDANNVKNDQLDIGNFVNKFLNKETNKMEDAKGYHKSLFTAMNPDVVANHFYQQGKADALKESMSKAKNVDMSPRGNLSNESLPGGMKVRALPSESSSDFKIKVGRSRPANKIT